MRPDDCAQILAHVAATRARSRALLAQASALLGSLRAAGLLGVHGLPVVGAGERAAEVATLLAARGDDDVGIGAAWVLRFGPIATDEQFVAILRTARMGRRRRAAKAPARPLE